MFLPTQGFLESYHRELLERARLARLLRERDSHLPKVQEQLLLKAGDSLIALGIRLKTLSRAPQSSPNCPCIKLVNSIRPNQWISCCLGKNSLAIAPLSSALCGLGVRNAVITQ